MWELLPLSFSPLPSEFIQLLQELQSRPMPRILDLGSGQGDFSQLLAPYDLAVYGLDRLPEVAGVQACIRADALHPPVLPGSLDAVVAGNLVRHLLVQCADGAFLQRWVELLRPGGSLFIFEDEPGLSDPAELNFKDLQEFLARLMPSTRGPLISRSLFKKKLQGCTPGLKWSTGLTLNEDRPDTVGVHSMLTGAGAEGKPGGPAGKLLDAIDEHGLSYGSFWWAHARFV